MIKLIAFDVDGTILNDEEMLTAKTEKELSKLLAEGIILVPCSARSFPAMPEWFKQREGIPYLVCHNGADIVDNYSAKTYISNTLSGIQALEATLFLLPKTRLFTYNIGTKMYSTMEVYEYLKPLDTDFKRGMFNYSNRVYIEDYAQFLETASGIGKIHICVDSDEEREDLYQFAQGIPGVAATSSHPQNIEVMHQHATKGYAMKTIMKSLKISPQEAMSFGDNDNDISLIEAVDYSVAMKNATPRLKKAAKYQTLNDNNNNGVVEMIEVLFEQHKS